MGITVRWAPPKPPEQRVSGIMAVVKLLRAQEPSGAMLGAAVLLIVAAIAFYLRTASAQTTASSTEASSQLAQLDARRTTTKTGSRHADAPIAPGTLPECLENLRAHFLEYRYLEAGELLARIRAHLSAGKLQGGDAAAVEQLHLLLEQDAELGQLERRCAEIHAEIGPRVEPRFRRRFRRVQDTCLRSQVCDRARSPHDAQRHRGVGGRQADQDDAHGEAGHVRRRLGED